MTCPVCRDYGVYDATGDRCECRGVVSVRNGEPMVGTRTTRELAGLWFDGADAQETADSAGVTRAQLDAAIRYEAHRRG